MGTLESTQPKPEPLPRWLVGAVVLLTGCVTAGAMWMTRGKGPQLAWDAAHATVEGAWGEPWERAPSPNLPPVPAAPGNGWTQTVAGVSTVPPIVAGAPIPHVDRGACTNCHAVRSTLGTPLPTIRSYSAMTHEFRGVCVNCHQVTLSAAGSVMAAAAPLAPAAPAPPAAPRQPSEAEWQGLEVGPGTSGVVVNGAEAAAGRRGLLSGDAVVSINGTPIRSMLDFVEVTQTGKLAVGTVIVDRKGQRLAFELGQPPSTGPAPQFPQPSAPFQPWPPSQPWPAAPPRTAPEVRF